MMKKRIITFLASIVLLAIFQVCHTPAAYAGKLSKFEIICGNTNDCNMETSSCLICKYKHNKWYTAGIKTNQWWEYICVPKGVTTATSLKDPGRNPVECSDTAGRGGRNGAVQNVYFSVIHKDVEDGYNCVTDNLRNMYHSVCYSCVIVDVLISAFVKAGSKAYDVSRQLANAILVVATILWLAMYVLKSVSSFSTVEPMKMIQDILFQLFKVFVAFTIVNAGISTIISYTVTPIINTGTDFGMAILKSVNEKYEQNKKDKEDQKAYEEARDKLIMQDQELRNLYIEMSAWKRFGDTEKAQKIQDELNRKVNEKMNSGGAK